MLDLPIKVYMKSKTKGYDAQGVFDGSGITVLAGSRADLTTRDSIRGSGEDRLRRQYLNSEGVLTQDLYVRSVSTACAMALLSLPRAGLIRKGDRERPTARLRKERRSFAYA